MVTIIGINVKNRKDEATKLQEILTKYGCYIKTRIGFHPMGEYTCNNFGIVLIEVVGRFNEIYDVLTQNWDIQVMKF